MNVRQPIRLPDDVQQNLRRAKRLEWVTFAYMFSCVVVIYLTQGQSQAMKAVWVEDILGLIPPAAYLISAHWRWKAPTKRFPYGYHHAVSIAFLCAAVALLGLGTLILFDSLSVLVKREHPTVGVVELFGRQVWLGWLMYPALLYSIAGMVVIGRKKLPVARDLHDKTLAADAKMNKADWMTAIAGIAGITGIALGWWWMDAVAAGAISVAIVNDGWEALREVITDLMDEVPTVAEEGQDDDWEQKLVGALRTLDWIRDVDVRLREEGNVFTGEVFVVPATTEGFERRVVEVRELARNVDWRFWDLSLVAVEKL
jgi:divalent metal cation (Fe/Co/Zn/Cd) transporter